MDSAQCELSFLKVPAVILSIPLTQSCMESGRPLFLTSQVRMYILSPLQSLVTQLWGISGKFRGCTLGKEFLLCLEQSTSSEPLGKLYHLARASVFLSVKWGNKSLPYRSALEKKWDHVDETHGPVRRNFLALTHSFLQYCHNVMQLSTLSNSQTFLLPFPPKKPSSTHWAVTS